MKYLTFFVNDKKIGIKYSYLIELTHINKTFTKDGNEFINYKGKDILVLDTGMIIDNKPLKRFDGLIFITINNKIIAFKAEGFFKYENNFDKELNPSTFF